MTQKLEKKVTVLVETIRQAGKRFAIFLATLENEDGYGSLGHITKKLCHNKVWKDNKEKESFERSIRKGLDTLVKGRHVKGGEKIKRDKKEKEYQLVVKKITKGKGTHKGKEYTKYEGVAVPNKTDQPLDKPYVSLPVKWCTIEPDQLRVLAILKRCHDLELKTTKKEIARLTGIDFGDISPLIADILNNEAIFNRRLYVRTIDNKAVHPNELLRKAAAAEKVKFDKDFEASRKAQLEAQDKPIDWTIPLVIPVHDSPYERNLRLAQISVKNQERRAKLTPEELQKEDQEIERQEAERIEEERRIVEESRARRNSFKIIGE